MSISDSLNRTAAEFVEKIDREVGRNNRNYLLFGKSVDDDTTIDLSLEKIFIASIFISACEEGFLYEVVSTKPGDDGWRLLNTYDFWCSTHAMPRILVRQTTMSRTIVVPYQFSCTPVRPEDAKRLFEMAEAFKSKGTKVERRTSSFLVQFRCPKQNVVAACKVIRDIILGD